MYKKASGFVVLLLQQSRHFDDFGHKDNQNNAEFA